MMPFLMCVLHGLANMGEQLQPLTNAQVMPITEIGDGNAADQFHHKVRPARLGGATVKYLGNVRVIHQRQGLPLGLKTGHHLPGIHARFDDLQRHLAANRLLSARP